MILSYEEWQLGKIYFPPEKMRKAFYNSKAGFLGLYKGICCYVITQKARQERRNVFDKYKGDLSTV